MDYKKVFCELHFSSQDSSVWDFVGVRGDQRVLATIVCVKGNTFSISQWNWYKENVLFYGNITSIKDLKVILSCVGIN